METTEVIRRCQSGTGPSRDTVRKSIAAAKEAWIAWYERVPMRSSLAGWRESAGPARVCEVSDASLRRFALRHRKFHRSLSTVRMETSTRGQVAELDCCLPILLRRSTPVPGHQRLQLPGASVPGPGPSRLVRSEPQGVT